MDKQFIEIQLVIGREGESLYVNGHRVVGSKPWGGGTLKKTWTVNRARFEEQMKQALPSVADQ